MAFRYRYALLDDTAAARFTETFAATIEEFATPPAPAPKRAPDAKTGPKSPQKLARAILLDGSAAAARFSPSRVTPIIWRDDRVAEGTRLLSGRRSKAYRGFESLSLRKVLK